jgi:hypothetical protein
MHAKTAFGFPNHYRKRPMQALRLRDLVKTVPHVAFEVDDLAAAIRDQKVIIEPNRPSNGVPGTEPKSNRKPRQIC